MSRRYIASLSGYGIRDDGIGLEFVLDREVDARVARTLARRGWKRGRFTAVLVPGAGRPTKKWPVDYFAHTAVWLEERVNAQVLMLGDSRDMERAALIAKTVKSSIPLAGELDLMESACVLSRADLVISNDTGLMHLASALHLKTIAIFGPTTRELGFFPMGDWVRVVEHPGLSCRPCSHIGSRQCPRSHFRCMIEVKPAAVTAAAEPFLENYIKATEERNRERT
jgi:heptosyltransferase-2